MTLWLLNRCCEAVVMANKQIADEMFETFQQGEVVQKHVTSQLITRSRSKM